MGLIGTRSNRNLPSADPQTLFPGPSPDSPPTSTRTPATVQDAGGVLPFVLGARRGLWDGHCHVWGSWAARRGSREETPRRWSSAAWNGSAGRRACGEASLPSAAEEAGKARPNTPFPTRLSTGRGGRQTSAGAVQGHIRPRMGVPAGRAPRRPPRPRVRFGLTGPVPRPRPPAAPARRRPHSWPPPNQAKRPRPDGHCGRPGLPGGLLVAGQLSGREGGRQGEEEECGRSRKGAGAVGPGPGR